MYIILFVLLVISISFNFYLYSRRHLRHSDGDVIIIHKPDGGTIFSLELNDDPVDFHTKAELVFKVVDHQEESS